VEGENHDLDDYSIPQKAVPHMPSGSRIILVSTGVTSLTTITPMYLVYAASKGAIEQFVRIMAKDLGRKGITVNAVAPGPTETEGFREGKSEQTIDMIKALSPFNDLGRPEDIASAMMFLAGEESRWVSGQTIRVNGANMV
jgi:3-oxoacyl-[acyl-carrier protein] reductase